MSLAFCKILFWRNGGEFTETGLPKVANKDAYIRGRCGEPWDCNRCQLLHDWLRHLEQDRWAVSWECEHCIKQTEKLDAANNVERSLQGYYQAGRLPASYDDLANYDEDRPTLPGCMRCGWQTSFLQLILRRPKDR